jgi:hypothetical protein
MEPVYIPRGVVSSSEINSMARILGAPVTEPDGNRALTIEPGVHASLNLPAMVDVICQTDGNLSTSNKRVVLTEPARQIRPRSLRMRSTIITFSARFFALSPRDLPRRRSSSKLNPRSAVPFRGFTTMLLPYVRKKSSGDSETICSTPVFTNAA